MTGGVSRDARIATLGVVVPVLDEIARLGACLDALEAALAHLHRLAPGVVTRVVVVDDGSVDGSDALAAAHAGVDLVRSDARHVGVARAKGVAHLLEGSDPDTIWIATTDGDSRVPVDWAVRHLEAARRGAGALLGSVRPDPAELTGPQVSRWIELNAPRDDHDFIHGANLGVRGDLYLSVGGFASVASDEDVDLALRLRAAGARIVTTDAIPVVTSARLEGRAPSGFADYIAAELGCVGGAT